MSTGRTYANNVSDLLYFCFCPDMKYVKHTAGLYFTGRGGEVTYFHVDCHSIKNARAIETLEAAFGKLPDTADLRSGEIVEGDPPPDAVCAWCGKLILPEHKNP